MSLQQVLFALPVSWKGYRLFVQVHVALRSSKQMESYLNKLCEYRVGVSETSGRILKKFGVWATLHDS